MKCKDIDYLNYLDGTKTQDATSHISQCKKCKSEIEKLNHFLNIITTIYAEGKQIDKEIDENLKAINLSSMKRMPDVVAIKVKKLKEKGIAERLKKIVSKGKSKAEQLFEGILIPKLDAAPACPKDITKSDKGKKTKGRSKH